MSKDAPLTFWLVVSVVIAGVLKMANPEEWEGVPFIGILAVVGGLALMGGAVLELLGLVVRALIKYAEKHETENEKLKKEIR